MSFKITQDKVCKNLYIIQKDGISLCFHEYELIEMKNALSDLLESKRNKIQKGLNKLFKQKEFTYQSKTILGLNGCELRVGDTVHYRGTLFDFESKIVEILPNTAQIKVADKQNDKDNCIWAAWCCSKVKSAKPKRERCCISKGDKACLFNKIGKVLSVEKHYAKNLWSLKIKWEKVYLSGGWEPYGESLEPEDTAFHTNEELKTYYRKNKK